MVLIAGCAGAATPDTILVNGKVFTSNPAQPWAGAVAIRGDRVIAVGDTATIAALAGSSTRRLDAGGRTIIPGINDAHQHVGIAPASDRLDLPQDPTLDQLAAAIGAQVAVSPAGRLIQGEFSQTALGRSVVHPRLARCDCAESSGQAVGIHRARHAAQQPCARPDWHRRHREGSRGRPIRPRCGGPPRWPPRGVCRLPRRPATRLEGRAGRDGRCVSPFCRGGARLRDHLGAADGESAGRRSLQDTSSTPDAPVRLKVFPLPDARGRRRRQSTAVRRCRRSRRRSSRCAA